ncbi:unnamed protein product [Angiostrongylus costaricensis]|uniref:PALP domain-containing protein n=1 Tax=Angiostrongylus costaricensis TaxID=334426 RepID=A0A0R3PS83_ANGCS|nr:unnamed protein product [Angiostrongylus costaricensis]
MSVRGYNKISKSVRTDMYDKKTVVLLTDVKLEYFNVGGSLEDRAAIRMIEVAEQNGLTKENIVLAPASGNIAVGIALVCAVKGYKCVIVTPDRSPGDICNILKVVRVSGNKNDVPNSCYVYAKTLAESIKNSYFLDESVSGANPLAHYETTAAEIFCALEKKLQNFRVAAELKLFAQNKEWFKHSILLKEAFLMTRRLIREEGLMVGPSSGAAILAALKLGESLPGESNVVVIGADGIRNYM